MASLFDQIQKLQRDVELLKRGQVPVPSSGCGFAHATTHESGGADKVHHDLLTDYVAAEHIDWAASGAGIISQTNTPYFVDWSASSVGTISPTNYTTSPHASSHSASGSDEILAQDLGSGSSAASGQFMITDGSGGWGLGKSGLTLISQTVLSSSAATIELSNIPQNYNHLFMFSSLRDSRGSGEYSVSFLTFNSSSGASYTYYNQIVTGGSYTSRDYFNNDTHHYLTIENENGISSGGASLFANQVTTIFNYSSSVMFKTSTTSVTAFGTNVYPPSSTPKRDTWDFLWRSASAINTITLTPQAASSYVPNCKIELYGL